ncbi:MAG: DUF4258 domain-containing protein [Actinomycetota bacterium]|nr:DUF4258 domain-containing protein [Actinomycetota bacterium]
MAEFDIGDRFRPRERLLDNPALADKMVRRSISRRQIEAVLTNNEIIEVYEHDDRIRYVLLGHVDQRPLHVVVGQDDIIDAIVVRDVPALVCDLCEEVYYEPRVTDAVVRLLEQTDVAPGQAIAVEYTPADAA